ncbi:hypothetical protein P2318_26310 [Myxococcaceae bacterium GXIMD 01537]
MSSTRARAHPRLSGWGLLAFLALWLSGCATDYVARTQGARAAYEAEDYPRALSELDAEAKLGSEKDRLLTLLDRGMVLHASGAWKESIGVLAEADRLSGELDAVSVSEEAGALATSERNRAYRGEDFEKLMISVLQALNYAQLGQDEDALVEVRRVNERMEKMISDEKKPYEQLAIARYIGGVLREDQKDWDSAYIDYAKALELQPRMGALAEPLLRLAKKTGRDDAYVRLAEQFPDVAHAPLGPDEGQVVVVVESGRSPVKRSGERNYGDANELFQVPLYEPRGRAPVAKVRVGERTEVGVTVTSLDAVATLHLNDRIGRMLLKQFASLAVKGGLAAGVGALTKSKEVGALTFLVLNALNAPDLRSWLSLPAEFQLVRLRLPAGKHSLAISGGGRSVTREVEVKAGRVQTVVVRRY